MNVMLDYFVYLPDDRLCEAWRCTAVSAGYTVIPPNSAYPPRRHPDDHHLDWRKGRILQAYQIILISAGRGTFEFGPSRSCTEVKAGDILILFPGIWHRYEPDTACGWTENWIECRGEAYDIIASQGHLLQHRPVMQSSKAISDVFARIHQLAAADAVHNQTLLSTLALELLAHLVRPHEDTSRRMETAIDRIRMHMLENCADNRPIEDLSNEFGISYSYLRRLFLERTGMSIKEYQLNIRIQRSCDILTNTNQSIKKIADILGFSNTFHFSKSFKNRRGMSPTEWRHRTRKELP